MAYPTIQSQSYSSHFILIIIISIPLFGTSFPLFSTSFKFPLFARHSHSWYVIPTLFSIPLPLFSYSPHGVGRSIYYNTMIILSLLSYPIRKDLDVLLDSQNDSHLTASKPIDSDKLLVPFEEDTFLSRFHLTTQF